MSHNPAMERQEANIPASKKFWKRSEAGKDYDRQFTNLVGWYIDVSESERLLQMASGLKSARVLDVGCGTGRFLKRFPEGNKLTGMDLSESMLRETRSRLDSACLTAASAIELPFKDGTFDFVFSVRVMQHIRDQQKMMSEMARVCKPGGRVILVTYNSWSLLNLYKHIRMGWVGRVLNFPIGWILKQRSFFGPWGFQYDNYCSIPEVGSMMKKAGLRPEQSCGLSTGMPWFLQSFFIGKILEKIAPWLLKGLLNLALFIDRTLARCFPMKYFNDLILVSGVKEK